MNVSETAALLAAQDHILILTHKRPDGDTIGCAAGLCAALRALGKTAWALPNSDVSSLFAPYLEPYLAPAEVQPAFVVTVDLAARSLFTQEGEAWLKRGIDLAIDHHPSYEGFGKESCVDPGRAACGELIYDIVREWGPVTAEIALPLYVAVSTDTGCFQYSNTTPATHRIAAALMETGIDYAALNKKHFRTKSFQRLALEGRLTAEMEFHDGGKIAIAAVPLSLAAELGASAADMEDIAAFPGQIEGVETAVTIKEKEDGGCKLSVRTTGGLNASKVCGLLGGGGHAAGAGGSIPVPLEQAKAAVLEAIRTVQHG